jgi:tRNA pseudouridine55 synthase
VDGILNINKPPGKTSFSIVSLVRRLSGESRVGHGGTLDPAASGVLPICLGQGTRVTEFLLEAPKAYRAEIELGAFTDTDDATGSVISRGDPSGIGREEVLSALNSFCGLISQTPPRYSAVKHRGQPLYKLARMGVEVERKSRLRRIYRLELKSWQPPLATIEVECERGTYIRSLARDLGQLLGCGAHLRGLVRLRCGPFSLEDAVSLSQLEDSFRDGYWQRFIYPVDFVLLHLAAVVVDSVAEEDIRNGRPLVFTGGDGLKASPGERCRAYTGDGSFLGVLRFNSETGQWQPEKVFTRS